MTLPPIVSFCSCKAWASTTGRRPNRAEPKAHAQPRRGQRNESDLEMDDGRSRHRPAVAGSLCAFITFARPATLKHVSIRLNHSLVASCARLTRASIYFAKSLLKLDGLPGQAGNDASLWFDMNASRFSLLHRRRLRFTAGLRPARPVAR